MAGNCNISPPVENNNILLKIEEIVVARTPTARAYKGNEGGGMLK